MNVDALNFKENKYIKVSNVLTPREASLCTRAILYDDIQRPRITEDEIVPLTKTRYASPITESILAHVHGIVEQKTGLSLAPTYSYNRIYKPGDYLAKHTDRASCEISVTINLGYNYISDNPDYSWNIFVDGKEFVTNPGDMIIFRGTELEHWRDPFEGKEGSWQVQAFLHYVDINGKYKDFIFDGRPELGFPEESKMLPAGYSNWNSF